MMYYKVGSALKKEKKCPPNQNNISLEKAAAAKTSFRPGKFANKCIRSFSKERLPRQWKARKSGFLRIFFSNVKVNWENTYQLPFLFTTETKLRVFQFKFLHRRKATNDFLHKICKNETDSCSFCADSPETLFWDCRSTQTFWNNVS